MIIFQDLYMNTKRENAFLKEENRMLRNAENAKNVENAENANNMENAENAFWKSVDSWAYYTVLRI